MAEKRQLEFFLLRYVPDAVRDEFVNIGVVMVEPSESGSGFADVRFARDWRRVQRLDPGADVEMLEALEREIRGSLGEVKDRDVLKEWRIRFPTRLQLSPTRGIAWRRSRRWKLKRSGGALYLESRQAGRAKRAGGQEEWIHSDAACV